MAQISYRANLSSAIFPLTLAQAGRSVIVPGPDNTYDRRVDPEGEQKNAGIPQAIYLENVIPTANGYQSIGYTVKDSLSDVNYDRIDQVPALRSDQIYQITLAWNSPTALKSSNIDGLGTWTDVVFSGTAVYPSAGRISSAVVRGTCYVFIRGVSNQIYIALHDGSALTLTNATASLAGIVANDVVEICGSYNYLIAIKEDGSVAWSSTTTPLTFTPSLVTGAGSASPNNSYNRLDYIEANPNGFYVFTPSGIIVATYTGNSRYPWKFVPVVNTTQIVAFTSGDVNASSVIIIDGTGSIRQVQGNTAELIAPELATYFRQCIETDVFNYTSNTFTTQSNLASRAPKIYLLHDRYICVSCEATSSFYTAIIIYDIQLRRYGKLKINHNEIVLHDTLNVALNRNRIGIVNRSTGACHIVDFETDVVTSPHTAVLVLGKFQYVRSRNMVLDEIEIEGKFHGVSVRILPSLNGKTFDAAVVPAAVESTSTLQSYTCRTEAKNQSIVIKGQFSIEFLGLTFHPGGGR